MLEQTGNLVAMAGLALAACGIGGVAGEAEVPDGTAVRVRLNQTLHSDQHGTGSAFIASVTEPVYGVEGETLIPAGSVVQGEVVSFEEEPARLEIEFVEIEVRGETHDVEATRLEFGRAGEAAAVEDDEEVGLLEKDAHIIMPAGSILQLELLRPLPVSLETEANEESASDRHAASAD